jgi:hypothetical protein
MMGGEENTTRNYSYGVRMFALAYYFILTCEHKFKLPGCLIGRSP